MNRDLPPLIGISTSPRLHLHPPSRKATEGQEGRHLCPACHHSSLPWRKLQMEPIVPSWQAIKEWIPDEEPDLDWFNRPRNPNEPDPDGFDQTQAWKPEEIHLDDGRTLVLEYT